MEKNPNNADAFLELNKALSQAVYKLYEATGIGVTKLIYEKNPQTQQWEIEIKVT